MIKLTEELYGVVVPKEIEKFKISGFGFVCYKMFGRWVAQQKLPFYIGKIEIIGWVTKDEISQELLDKSNENAIRLLIDQKEIYFVNPMGINKPSFESRYIGHFPDYSYNESVKNWQHYQDNLIDKLLIIKKI